MEYTFTVADTINEADCIDIVRQSAEFGYKPDFSIRFNLHGCVVQFSHKPKNLFTISQALRQAPTELKWQFDGSPDCALVVTEFEKIVSNLFGTTVFATCKITGSSYIITYKAGISISGYHMSIINYRLNSVLRKLTTATN